MKKSTIFCAFCFFLCFCGGTAGACEQPQRTRNPAGFLVIDNIDFSTILEITNIAEEDVWLRFYIIIKEPGFKTKALFIHVTRHETFWCQTHQPYSRTDAHGVITYIRGVSPVRAECSAGQSTAHLTVGCEKMK